MTNHVKALGKRQNSNRQKVKLLIAVLAMVLLFVILMRSEKLSETIYSSLSETAKKVIPALFPMMVLARFMTNYGLVDFYEKISAGVVKRLFGVSRKASCAVILGFLSSFPIGAATVCELYNSGELTKEEAENSLGPAHNTGPAFPVCVIGAAVLGSVSYGTFLYFIQIISAVIASKLLIPKSAKQSTSVLAPHGKVDCSFSSTLTDAICSSAVGCLNIVAFVQFGRLLSELVYVLLNKNSIALLLTASVIEFSSGSVLSADAGGIMGLTLCSFSICFGGMTSLLQASSYTSKARLSIKKCFIFKLLQGILSSLLSFLVFFLMFW